MDKNDFFQEKCSETIKTLKKSLGFWPTCSGMTSYRHAIFVDADVEFNGRYDRFSETLSCYSFLSLQNIGAKGNRYNDRLSKSV